MIYIRRISINNPKHSMMELLKQQRIPFKELTIIPESELNPSEESKSIFRSMIEKFMNKNDSTTTATTTTTRNMAKVTKIDLTKYETMVIA